MAAILGSVNLSPLVFWYFYHNFVKHGSFVTKFCTHCHRQREQRLQIWLLYDFYFLMCAYIAAKLYVIVVDVYDHADDTKFSGKKILTYSLATIYAHTRKYKSYSNQICSLCSRCSWHCVYNILYMNHVWWSFSKNTKHTDGPKFTDPRTAAVSLYFKRSMVRTYPFDMGEPTVKR